MALTPLSYGSSKINKTTQHSPCCVVVLYLANRQSPLRALHLFLPSDAVVRNSEQLLRFVFEPVGISDKLKFSFLYKCNFCIYTFTQLLVLYGINGNHSSLSPSSIGRIASEARMEEITLCPKRDSISLRVLPAISPPSLASLALARKP